MKRSHVRTALAAALLATGSLPAAQAGQPGVYITEFLTATTSSNFFVEITNLTGADIDLSGWGYSNNAARANGEMLVLPESLAPLAAGESVFITSACDSQSCEDDVGEIDFHSIWGLNPAVKVIHVGNDDYSQAVLGLSSSRFQPSQSDDDLRLYNPSLLMVDQLVYPSSLVATDQSAHVKDTSQLNGGTQSTSNWAKSFVGDGYGSYAALTNQAGAPEVGNPNPLYSTFAPVPEPETYAMLLAGLGLVGLAVRRRGRSGRVCAQP